jgi:hypothetical protein
MVAVVAEAEVVVVAEVVVAEVVVAEVVVAAVEAVAVVAMPEEDKNKLDNQMKILDILLDCLCPLVTKMARSVVDRYILPDDCCATNVHQHNWSLRCILSKIYNNM